MHKKLVEELLDTSEDLEVAAETAAAVMRDAAHVIKELTADPTTVKERDRRIKRVEEGFDRHLLKMAD